MSEGFHVRWWPASTRRGVLLVVHGLQEHSGAYDAVARVLAAGGYEVGAVDLRGHGRSPGRRGHIEGFESDHLAAVDLLLREAERRDPASRPFLLGHSLGGLIVLRWAQSRVFADRLRGIVLLSPFIEPAIRVPGWKATLSRLMARVRPAFRLRTGIPDTDLFRDPNEAAAFSSDPLVQRYVSAGHWEALTRERRDLRLAAPIEVPMLVLLAGEDTVIDSDAARAFASMQPEATVIEYDDAYHALHRDPVVEVVIEDLRAWLDTRAGP